MGLKILTIYDSGIRHLDAGSTLLTLDKKRAMIYSDFWFKVTFWHRFIYIPEQNILLRCYSVICLLYTIFFTLLISLLKLEGNILKVKWRAIKDACRFLCSDSYRKIPKIVKNIL